MTFLAPSYVFIYYKRNEKNVQEFFESEAFLRTFDKLAFFGYNGAEGGELDMRREKSYIYMDSAEHRLAIVGMNHFRNHLIQTRKPTEDVDALLFKLWKAKLKHRDRRRKT